MFFKRDLIKQGSTASCSLRRAGTLFAILLGMISTAQAQQSNAGDPDYSGVNDFLRGRRTLLSINDLVFGGTILKTSDGTKIEDKNISELPAPLTPKEGSEIMARLFDSTSGTLVFINQKTLYAIDPSSQSTTSLSLEGYTSASDFASGDFRRDGFKEIVLASRSGVRLFSAADPKQFSKGLIAAQ